MELTNCATELRRRALGQVEHSLPGDLAVEQCLSRAGHVDPRPAQPDLWVEFTCGDELYEVGQVHCERRASGERRQPPSRAALALGLEVDGRRITRRHADGLQ